MNEKSDDWGYSRIDSGAPVYKKSECEGKDYKEWPVIKDPDGIKEGDVIYTCIMGGYSEGAVVLIGDSFYVDTPYNMTNLFYAEKDVEPCWVTSGAFNKKCIQMIK